MVVLPAVTETNGSDTSANELLWAALQAMEQPSSAPVHSFALRGADGLAAMVAHIVPIRRSAHDIFGRSYALMIVGAEYVARIVPRGTHDYAKFIRPSELDRWARKAGLVPQDVMGLRYNPLLKSASLNASDIDVNYLMHCRKPAED